LRKTPAKIDRWNLKGGITPELTRRAHNLKTIQVSRMKAMLFALRLNELLRRWRVSLAIMHDSRTNEDDDAREPEDTGGTDADNEQPPVWSLDRESTNPERDQQCASAVI
jgi:hypothetical protein